MTVGPWHDAIAAHYEALRHFAPTVGAEYLAQRYGLTAAEVVAIWRRCHKRRDMRRVA